MSGSFGPPVSIPSRVVEVSEAIMLQLIPNVAKSEFPSDIRRCFATSESSPVNLARHKSQGTAYLDPRWTRPFPLSLLHIALSSHFKTPVRDTSLIIRGGSWLCRQSCCVGLRCTDCQLNAIPCMLATMSMLCGENVKRIPVSPLPSAGLQT